MLISVCIPTRNRIAMLKEALRSAMDQDCSDCEIVVSDNASTDGSGDWVSNFGGGRVRLLRQVSNIGSVANHNACVRAAFGQWILFLHDDDLLRDGGMRLVVDFLRKHEACDVALPDYMGWLLKGEVFDNCLKLLNGISMSSTLFRRDLLVQFPFHTDNVCCDWEVLFQSALHGRRLCTYPFDLIERRHHPGQEGALVAFDGRGIIGKTNAVRRLCAQFTNNDWLRLCERIVSSWQTDQIMSLARFVHNSGYRDHFSILRDLARAHNKWRRASKQGAVILAEGLFGLSITSQFLRPWKAWNRRRHYSHSRRSLHRTK